MITRENAERFLCNKYRIKDVKGVVIPSDEVVGIMVEFAEESVNEKGLPLHVQEALNSGDGIYRP